MIDFHRLIFIVIADDLPWPLLRKLGMHFSILKMVIELAPHKLYFHNLCMLPAHGRKVDLPRSIY